MFFLGDLEERTCPLLVSATVKMNSFCIYDYTEPAKCVVKRSLCICTYIQLRLICIARLFYFIFFFVGFFCFSYFYYIYNLVHKRIHRCKYVTIRKPKKRKFPRSVSAAVEQYTKITERPFEIRATAMPIITHSSTLSIIITLFYIIIFPLFSRKQTRTH